MMKKILFFGALLGVCLGSYAQSSLKIKYEGKVVGDTIFVSLADSLIVDEIERVIELEFANESNASMSIRYIQEPLIVPSGAEGFYFCGEWPNANCQEIGTNTTPENVNIAAASSENLALHYWANDVKSTAAIRCIIQDVNNSSNTDSVIVYYNRGNLGITPSTIKTEVSIEAYPNPVINNLNIRYSLSKAFPNTQIVVRNMLGSIVKQAPLYDAQGKLSINVEDLSNGIYFYSVVSSGQVLTTKKIIIKH